MTFKPFEIIGADRPSRWLVTCDHASNIVPPDVSGGILGICDADMNRHIAYDVGAAGVTRTSRLACQIVLDVALDGLEVRIPGESRDMQRR